MINIACADELTGITQMTLFIAFLCRIRYLMRAVQPFCKEIYA